MYLEQGGVIEYERVIEYEEVIDWEGVIEYRYEVLYCRYKNWFYFAFHSTVQQDKTKPTVVRFLNKKQSLIRIDYRKRKL